MWNHPNHKVWRWKNPEKYSEKSNSEIEPKEEISLEKFKRKTIPLMFFISIGYAFKESKYQ